MNKPLTLRVRIIGPLGEFVAANVGGKGSYENASEYVRDLTRQDKPPADAEQFAVLKAELSRAFDEPELAYVTLDAEAIVTRNQRS